MGALTREEQWTEMKDANDEVAGRSADVQPPCSHQSARRLTGSALTVRRPEIHSVLVWVVHVVEGDAHLGPKRRQSARCHTWRGGVRGQSAIAPLAILSFILLLSNACGSVEQSPGRSTHDAPIDEVALAQAIVRFARAPSAETAEDLPFDDQVSLGLGDQVLEQRTAADLVDPDNWSTDAGPAGFRERTGPFNPLDVLAEAGRTVVTTGPYESCNSFGENAPAPIEFGDHARISIQPDPGVVAACMHWWSVDLYVTPAGEIAAVMVDYGAP